MTNNHHNDAVEQIYTEAKANLKQVRRISPFWLLPFIALCIGAILFFQIIQEQGYTIKITFANGEGLVAGKTQVRYQGLQIGVVKKVSFTNDLKQVEVIANIYPEAKTVLRENTKFWLVKPSASLAGISGIDALVSGNYITLQPGDGDSEDKFVAETEGPIAQVDDGDLLVHLLADDLGSISIGASVYFKKLPVGKIYDYRFVEDGKKVSINLVIDKAYAHFVKKDSHFWNISGIDAQIGLSGININVDSLNAIVQGAVAFDSPSHSELAQNHDKFTLYANFNAAKRGIPITITLPNTSGLQTGQTSVYYQNKQIGVLSELNEIENNAELLTGTLLVDPLTVDLFTNKTNIVLRNKKLSLGDLANIQNLLRGEYFEVIAGLGEPQTSFTVIKENELLLQQPNTLVLTLTSPETYGVSEGQPIYYNNITIGEIIAQTLDIEGVTFKIAIAEKYRHLIHQDTRFIAASNLDINLDVNGLRFEAASPEKWLQGGIRVLGGQQNQGQPLAHYPLYKDITHAESGITDGKLTPTITLTTATLPSISQGSLVLYRQYEVGKILEIRPKAKTFEVDVFIYPKHRELLTSKSIFWVESAAQIDITAKGISIQATPIARSLKGAVSFDNTGNGSPNTLYPNELRAKSAGQQLTFTTDDATNLVKGMSLRYLGLTIGEIDQINLDTKSNKVIAKALINPQYMALVAKEGSRFTLISPQISAGGIENLESLLQPYIDVEMGSGKTKTQFQLIQSAPRKNNQYAQGFPLVLETHDALNITTGSPVLYRGVEVGTINQIKLNELGDRVFVHILIAQKYKHLVRENSEFWIAAGYDFSFGLSGAEVNTGSVQQLLKGGIAFSTPTTTVIQPAAKANQHFLLQIKRPADAPQWNSGALPK
ncbi:MlaD family protein [Pasteurella oralis]|uniref:MlaD family protein n=1 Tax=Pasteurella oralis TaxID=1071947 RepID=A0ABW4NSC5_9PAST|nr:PqiB family protein [Pasteurella oralis]MDO5055180.1 MlaD family protein [Pasteurella oralis]